MLTRRSLVVALVGVNLLLALGLLLAADPLPTAYAQAGAGGGRGYLCATAAVSGQEFEMLYIADLQGRRLYALGPINAQTKALEFLGVRDLRADFRGEAPAPPPGAGGAAKP
ncbi:MAG: hypothetical protein IT449_08715 [Phycisphaerales bacterium]|nr:hypothetical protein [Phycisphaerales bacterium]